MANRFSKMVDYLKIILIVFFVFESLFLQAASQNCGYYDFEFGEGSGWKKDCFGGHDWTLDLTQGNNSSKGSMKSADLGKGTETLGLGVSGICRNVTGPAYISFWWKSDNSPQGCGRLSFLVDGNEKLDYDGANWSPKSYSLPENKTYQVEWRYTKKNAKLYKGSGWIDDVSITPTFRGLLANLNCIIEAPDLAREGSTYLGSSIPTDGLDYNWNISGGEIIGGSSKKSIKWRADSNSSLTSLTLRVIKPMCCSATCRKNITILPKDFPYKNMTVPQLCGSIRMPLANVTYVGAKNDPPNYRFVSINDAINNVSSGGRVMVDKGIYNENIYINKPISLIGSGTNDTIIREENDVIYINANDVKIKNLTVMGGDIGIYLINSDRSELLNLYIFRFAEFGIKLKKSKLSIIKNCILDDVDTGIYLYLSRNSTLQNNTLSDTSFSGFALTDSCFNLIDNNTFLKSSLGINLKDCSRGNNITDTNKFYGITTKSHCDICKSQIASKCDDNIIDKTKFNIC